MKYLKRSLGKLLFWSAAASLFCIAASATTVFPADCTADLTACFIGENTLYQLPFLAISGDVILLEADMVTVSDVFRIFNDFFDTGGGTGLGLTAFLFSADDFTPLPDPSTYSSNAIFITEAPSGVTHFNGNGTDYFLGVPEPATFALVGLGLLMALLAQPLKRIVSA